MAASTNSMASWSTSNNQRRGDIPVPHLKQFSIDINQYIYRDNGKTTLKEGPTTLEGIEFVAQNKAVGRGEPVVGIDGLRDALALAKKGGKRAFAGQILADDRSNAPLQASFMMTDGLGFREIFYLSQLPESFQDPRTGNVVSSDSRSFDARFGKMVDALDITSLHAALDGPVNPGGLVDSGNNRPGSASMTKSTIHLDKEGFVFADSDGRIFLSSNAIQHTGDELGIKDKLLDGNSPLSFFFHTDLNSISDPGIGSADLSVSAFLRGRSPRGILGLEVSTKPKGLQLYVRGSLGIHDIEIRLPKRSDFSGADVTGVIGLRKRF